MTEEIKMSSEEWAKETVRLAGQIAGLEWAIDHLKQENEKLKESLKMYQYSDQQHLLKVIEYEKAFEEIREMLITCKEEYCCEKCKYCDECEELDALFPDVNETILKKINEVLN